MKTAIETVGVREYIASVSADGTVPGKPYDRLMRIRITDDGVEVLERHDVGPEDERAFVAEVKTFDLDQGLRGGAIPGAA
jgi:hypothetical protein